MARQKATRDSKGGPKSEVITIRLDPRLKYLAGLAARRQRRPLSSYVEWAIERSLHSVHPSYDADDSPSLAEEASNLWDVDEADRFANLALKYPDLLDHEEQIVWKLIRENGFVWQGRSRGGQWVWSISRDDLIKERLREHWPTFLGVARGELPSSKLPKWDENTAIPAPPELDDEIPF